MEDVGAARQRADLLPVVELRQAHRALRRRGGGGGSGAGGIGSEVDDLCRPAAVLGDGERGERGGVEAAAGAAPPAEGPEGAAEAGGEEATPAAAAREEMVEEEADEDEDDGHDGEDDYGREQDAAAEAVALLLLLLVLPPRHERRGHDAAASPRGWARHGCGHGGGAQRRNTTQGVEVVLVIDRSRGREGLLARGRQG